LFGSSQFSIFKKFFKTRGPPNRSVSYPISKNQILSL
jgi:hypothetical protein